MDTYAIIQVGGSQFKVSPGAEIVVSRLDPPTEKTIPVDQVLLYHHNGHTEIGNPYLSTPKLTMTVLTQVKGTKLKISKYKAKSRYQKEIGFRSKLTRVRFNDFAPQTEKVVTPKKVSSKKK